MALGDARGPSFVAFLRSEVTVLYTNGSSSFCVDVSALTSFMVQGNSRENKDCFSSSFLSSRTYLIVNILTLTQKSQPDHILEELLPVHAFHLLRWWCIEVYLIDSSEERHVIDDCIVEGLTHARQSAQVSWLDLR